MIDGNLLDKLYDKIDKCNYEISQGINVEIRQHQLEHYNKRVNQILDNRRLITDWESENDLWFDGSDSDVYSFNDLIAHCNECCFGEKPLDLIRMGVFYPIGNFSHDLREYIYLPVSLIREVGGQ